MTYLPDPITMWDRLHVQPRHQTRYPSEHAVRFLANAVKQLEQIEDGRRLACALDIGCGSGRHAQLLLDTGMRTWACDLSEEAVRLTRERLDLDEKYVVQASMIDLPYATDTFDVAIAFGVFYYGTTIDHELAVAELHRVLAPGGQALVVHRTTHDSRCSQAFLDGPTDLKLHMPDHPEDGMIMNFLTAHGIELIYAPFATLNYERTETTRDDRAWVDSDWLITVSK